MEDILMSFVLLSSVVLIIASIGGVVQGNVHNYKSYALSIVIGIILIFAVIAYYNP